jgi:alpha-tubulin suppressor-like RCC1 family protein
MQNNAHSNDIQSLGFNNHLQRGGVRKDQNSRVLEPLELTPQSASQHYTSVKAGTHHTLLLTTDGQVYMLGSLIKLEADQGKPKLLTFPGLASDEHIVQIDTSRDHNIALTSQGRVYTWGNNYMAQLGDGTNKDRAMPALVQNLPKASYVTAGYRHSAIITIGGSVYAWGGSCSSEALSEAQVLIEKARANIAALGGYTSTSQADLKSNDVEDCTTQASTFVQSKTPQKLVGLGGKKAMNLSAGYGHLMVTTDGGELYSAGCNTFQQLGRTKGSDAKRNDLYQVNLPDKVTAIAAGFRHSSVLLRDGSVWAWGYNGPLGDTLIPGNGDSNISQPLKMPLDEGVLSIEAAHDTTFAVTKSLKIIGWGQDDAKAFWDSNKPNVHQLGTATSDKTLLSGGPVHLLVFRNL